MYVGTAGNMSCICLCVPYAGGLFTILCPATVGDLGWVLLHETSNLGLDCCAQARVCSASSARCTSNIPSLMFLFAECIVKLGGLE